MIVKYIHYTEHFEVLKQMNESIAHFMIFTVILRVFLFFGAYKEEVDRCFSNFLVNERVL